VQPRSDAGPAVRRSATLSVAEAILKPLFSFPRILGSSHRNARNIANVIITPDLSERERLLVTRSKFIRVEGVLQNQDGVIHIKAQRLRTLAGNGLEIHSHDFHLALLPGKGGGFCAKSQNPLCELLSQEH
jgi:hypothetical protein